LEIGLLSPASKVKLVFQDANIFFLNRLCLPRKVDVFEELREEIQANRNFARLLDAFYEKSNLVENETSVFHTFFCLLAKTETVGMKAS